MNRLDLMIIKQSLRKFIAGTGLVLLVAFYVAACTDPTKNKNTQIEEVAGNEEVLHFMKTFDGRGALSDSSEPVMAAEAVRAFQVADDSQSLM